MNVVLWILQVLLALLFLFAGGTKVSHVRRSFDSAEHA